MKTLSRLFWLAFIIIMFVPGAVAHRSGRSPGVQSVMTGTGDIGSPGGNYNVPDNTTLIKADATAGNMTVTLPDASTVSNVNYTIIKIDATTNTVTIDVDGGGTIAGSSDYVLRKQWDTLRTNSDGTNFIVAVAMQEPVDIRLFDVKGDGVTDDRAAINTAATIAAGEDLIFYPGTYKISTDLVLDENVIVQSGASLDVDIGATLTFTASFSAPPIQVFNGAGEIDFSANAVDAVNPGWWGSGMQAWDHAVGANGSIQNIVIPQGTNSIIDDLDLLESAVIANVGAVLDISAGKTVVIDGPFVASNDNHFDGDGEVDFGSDSVPSVSPAWWGSGVDAIDHSVVAANRVQNIEFPPGNFSINDDVDLLEYYVTLNQGTVLDVDSGKTVVIDGSFNAPMTAIVFTGDGEIDFGTDSVESVNPNWWGSDASAINHSVQAANRVQNIEFPPGNFSINDDVDLLEYYVRLNQGTVLDIDAGQTVTFAGDLDASNTNHFDGDGDVTFDNGSVESVYPQWFGAVGDGVTNSAPAISDAIDAGGGWEELTILPGDYVISDNVDLSGKVIRLEDGSFLDIDSGIIFTIGSGRIEAGLSQIFKGDGTVAFDDDATQRILPQWWGAVADDTVDCSSAFNKAVAAARGIAPIYVPGGTYKLVTPITGWTGQYYAAHVGGPDIIGAGMETTILKYYGTSGYAIEVDTTSDKSVLAPVNVRVQNVHIQAPNIASQGVTDSGGGILFAGVNGAQVENVSFTNFDGTYGYAIHARGRNVSDAVTAVARDDNVDFGTTGGASNEKYALQFTPTFTSSVKQATVRLGITGAPAGTVLAYIYDDSSGPDTQIQGASEAITINTISSAADGEDVEFTWTLNADMPDVTASTVYWLVLETVGYTYTDGATELRLRTDDGDGSADTISTYDAAWSFEVGTADDDYDLDVITRYGMGVISQFVNVRCQGDPSALAAVSLKLEEGAQAMIRGGTYRGAACVESDSSLIMASGGTEFSSTAPAKCLNIIGGNTYWTGVYFEGGGTAAGASLLTGGTHRFDNCSMGVHIDRTQPGRLLVRNSSGPYAQIDDATYQEDWFEDILYNSYQVGTTDTTDTVDADAMAGQSVVWSGVSDGIGITFLNGGTAGRFLTPGTYMIEAWLKDTNQITLDVAMRLRYDSPAVTVNRELYTLTSTYAPYRMLFTVDADSAYTTHTFQILKTRSNANSVSFSHLRIRYLGPDTPSNNDLSLYNPAQSDADGARDTSINFTGDRVQETLSERDFATHANWDTTGDFDDTGGNAAYTHSSGAGTLTQAHEDWIITRGLRQANRQYSFTYTVSGTVGDPAATITTSFALAGTSLTIADGTQTTLVASSLAAPNDFVISATSDSGDDTFTIDDVRLEMVGASQSLLASITASHDGTDIDENGKIVFAVNAGEDAFAPTDRFSINSSGDVRAGTSVNYTQFASDGTLTLVGDATVLKTIDLSGASFEVGSTAPTGVVVGNYKAWEYGIGDDSVLTFELPHEWAEGTDLTIKIDWAIDRAYASESAEVQWSIDWSAVPHDETEALDGAGTNIDPGDTNIPATANYLTRTVVGTISGASLAAEDEIGMTISRVALDAGVNPGGGSVPYITHLYIEYVSDKLGE